MAAAYLWPARSCPPALAEGRAGRLSRLLRSSNPLGQTAAGSYGRSPAGPARPPGSAAESKKILLKRSAAVQPVGSGRTAAVQPVGSGRSTKRQRKFNLDRSPPAKETQSNERL
jgi:hypothetical protein